MLSNAADIIKASESENGLVLNKKYSALTPLKNKQTKQTNKIKYCQVPKMTQKKILKRKKNPANYTLVTRQ